MSGSRGTGEKRDKASGAPPSQVLIVEDDAAVRFGVRRYLERRGLTVFEAATCGEAREQIGRETLGAAILDLHLPDGDGLKLLREMRQRRPELAVVLLTGTGTIESAVAAMKLGACDFLVKPLDLEVLAGVLDDIFVAAAPAAGKRPAAGGKAAAPPPVDPFAGDSTAIRELASRARLIAAADATVLLLGETGTGKGVLARWLHANGRRRDAPMLELNCAALSRDLLGSELFGHLPGAFTGADRRKVGLLEAADGGTLLLDEIGDMDLDLQPKLLKVLEEKTFRPLGQVESQSVDVRLIAATHPTLVDKVQSGEFRQDLFFRINTLPLRLPSLRHRLDDLPLLAAAILDQLARAAGQEPRRLTDEAFERLRAHPWPGNIRELRNVLERAVLLSPEGELGPEALWFEELGTSAAAAGRPTTLADAERQVIEQALEAESGHVGRAAERLGIARSTLYDKLKKLPLDDESSTNRTAGPEGGQ